ncbi:hypothetical protein [Halomonas sp. 141]|uniref:hypothetical protein n=1 Tax=Halomonas sp. 141 TaxID=2056666 RepID=UPI0012FD3276|nr:hypothetical protein [Halomonas sp. 141]
MSRDPLRRDNLEQRLHRQAMSGDSAAFLRLRGLRRLWRTQDTNRKTRNQGENHHVEV